MSREVIWSWLCSIEKMLLQLQRLLLVEGLFRTQSFGCTIKMGNFQSSLPTRLHEEWEVKGLRLNLQGAVLGSSSSQFCGSFVYQKNKIKYLGGRQVMTFYQQSVIWWKEKLSPTTNATSVLGRRSQLSTFYGAVQQCRMCGQGAFWNCKRVSLASAISCSSWSTWWIDFQLKRWSFFGFNVGWYGISATVRAVEASD